MSRRPHPADRGLGAVARVREVRERDSRLGLVAALADLRAREARVGELEAALREHGSFVSGDMATFVALRESLTALREEDETLQSLLSTLAPAVRYVANAAGNGPWVDLYARPPVLPSDDQRCALGDCG